MSRERGKPRCGPAWYSMAARQKKLQKLERALSIAHTQKAKLARKDGRERMAKLASRDGKERMAWSPPAVFVEEVIPEEAI